MKKLPADRNFLITLLLSIVTLGVYGLYLIHCFAKEVNTTCVEDGKRTNGLIVLILLSIITLGIYSLVWECQVIIRCNSYLVRKGRPEGLQVSTYLLTVLLLGYLTLGIMYLVVLYKRLTLQNAVNQTYNELNNL